MSKEKVTVHEPKKPETIRMLEEDPRSYFAKKERAPFGFVAPKGTKK